MHTKKNAEGNPEKVYTIKKLKVFLTELYTGKFVQIWKGKLTVWME